MASGPLVVTSGQMALFYASLIPNPYFRLEGTTFNVSNSTPADWIPRDWGSACSSAAAGLIPAADCRGGDSVDLSFSVDGDLGTGPATIDGRQYDMLSYRGTLTAVTDPVIFQPADEEAFGFVSVRTGFTFTGSLRGFNDGQQVFTRSFIGRGTAHMRWENEGARVDGRPVFSPGGDGDDGPSYEFAQTAEPASLLLTATGIAALASRVRRRRLC